MDAHWNRRLPKNKRILTIRRSLNASRRDFSKTAWAARSSAVKLRTRFFCGRLGCCWAVGIRSADDGLPRCGRSPSLEGMGDEESIQLLSMPPRTAVVFVVVRKYRAVLASTWAYQGSCSRQQITKKGSALSQAPSLAPKGEEQQGRIDDPHTQCTVQDRPGLTSPSGLQSPATPSDYCSSASSRGLCWVVWRAHGEAKGRPALS